MKEKELILKKAFNEGECDFTAGTRWIDCWKKEREYYWLR
jgi:hypothetical protein